MNGLEAWSPEDAKTGGFILSAMASLDKDINIVRHRIHYLERRKVFIRKAVKVAIWSAIGVIIALSLMGCSEAWAMTASYYTYESCIREGTSGICANGERLNDNGFTCASWDYNFGDLLNVTNLSNNRRVIVRVNDRGPSKRLYKKGRKLDLSLKAMDALGGVDRGVIKVTIERI